MGEDSMKSRIYAVVIRTNNIENLRNFYRDVLDLGPPVVDSNHWVEFKLGEATNLVLEAIDPDASDTCVESGSRVDWALRIDDLDAEKERLAEAKLEPAGEEADRFGKRVLKYLDPDGNLIHLISEKE